MRALGKKAAGERLERMQASPQWRDGRFVNVRYHPPPGPRAAMPLKEFLCPKERRKPLAPLPTVDPTEVWRAPPQTGLRATWLGHSTVLFEIGGRRALTDPMWGKRASPTRGVGPKRFQPPVIPLDRLPPLDLILLSHDHYDHLDYSTIRKLAGLDVPFVASLGVGAHLESWGIEPERITELDWWERAGPFDGDLTVTAAPAQHFSGRAPGSANHTLWSSFVLEVLDARVFFGGDSGMTPWFADIGSRWEAFDLVLLEIGAYHPAWGDIHLGPENALRALDALGGGPLLPIHWGTFDLATHRWDRPVEVLTERGSESGARILTPRLGEAVEPGLGDAFDRWWRDVARLHGEGPDPVDESLGKSEVVGTAVD